MKKYFALILSFIMLFLICGCKEEKNEPKKTETVIKTESTAKISKDKDGVYKVKNADDKVTFALVSDPHVGYSGIYNVRFKRTIEYINKNADIDFTLITGDNVENGLIKEQVELFKKEAKAFKKPYFALAGNHCILDEEFERNMIIECGDIRIIGFWPHFDMPANNIEVYKHQGKVSDKTLSWLEEAFEKSKDKRILVACHYSIQDEGNGFFGLIKPNTYIPEGETEPVDYGREKILSLCEKYGAELYFNGHEHTSEMPTGVTGSLTSFNLPALGENGRFAVVTIENNTATVELKVVSSFSTVKTVNYNFK